VPVDFGGGQEDLRHEIQQIMHTRTLEQWMELAAQHRLPISPAYSDIRELPKDPHLAYLGVFRDGKHPVAGEFSYLSEPARVRGQTFELGRPAPTLGEHTHEMLLDLGYTDHEIEAMASSGTVGPIDEGGPSRADKRPRE
jgi:crotonobetainyl-CoA:carnitine CoA-transferase CaiB-like acyl-CoA transferase